MVRPLGYPPPCHPTRRMDPITTNGQHIRAFMVTTFSTHKKSHCQAARRNTQTLLDRTATVFDWTGLGLHTGSRLGEYGQSKPEKGSAFARVPQGPCAGQALAFVKRRFRLFRRRRPLSEPYHPPRRTRPRRNFPRNFPIRQERHQPQRPKIHPCYELFPVPHRTVFIHFTTSTRPGRPIGVPTTPAPSFSSQEKTSNTLCALPAKQHTPTPPITCAST